MPHVIIYQKKRTSKQRKNENSHIAISCIVEILLRISFVLLLLLAVFVVVVVVVAVVRMDVFYLHISIA